LQSTELIKESLGDGFNCVIDDSTQDSKVILCLKRERDFSEATAAI